MRHTPLPPLSELPVMVLVSRCEFCRRMTLGTEICQGSKEADACPPRSMVEVRFLSPLPPPAVSGHFGRFRFGPNPQETPCA